MSFVLEQQNGRWQLRLNGRNVQDDITNELRNHRGTVRFPAAQSQSRELTAALDRLSPNSAAEEVRINPVFLSPNLRDFLSNQTPPITDTFSIRLTGGTPPQVALVAAAPVTAPAPPRSNTVRTAPPGQQVLGLLIENRDRYQLSINVAPVLRQAGNGVGTIPGTDIRVRLPDLSSPTAREPGWLTRNFSPVVELFDQTGQVIRRGGADLISGAIGTLFGRLGASGQGPGDTPQELLRYLNGEAVTGNVADLVSGLAAQLGMSDPQDAATRARIISQVYNANVLQRHLRVDGDHIVIPANLPFLQQIPQPPTGQSSRWEVRRLSSEDVRIPVEAFREQNQTWQLRNYPAGLARGPLDPLTATQAGQGQFLPIEHARPTPTVPSTQPTNLPMRATGIESSDIPGTLAFRLVQAPTAVIFMHNLSGNQPGSRPMFGIGVVNPPHDFPRGMVTTERQGDRFLTGFSGTASFHQPSQAGQASLNERDRLNFQFYETRDPALQQVPSIGQDIVTIGVIRPHEQPTAAAQPRPATPAIPAQPPIRFRAGEAPSGILPVAVPKGFYELFFLDSTGQPVRGLTPPQQGARVTSELTNRIAAANNNLLAAVYADWSDANIQRLRALNPAPAARTTNAAILSIAARSDFVTLRQQQQTIQQRLHEIGVDASVRSQLQSAPPLRVTLLGSNVRLAEVSPNIHFAPLAGGTTPAATLDVAPPAGSSTTGQQIAIRGPLALVQPEG